MRNRRTQQLVTTVALHDMLAGEHASPAALDAVAGLRPLMDDAIARYGTQNPLVSHLAFLQGFLTWREADAMMYADAKILRGFVRAGPLGDWL